jgi:hypothetical protein
LPSPLPSFAVANLQKIIEGCNSDLQILTLEKWQCGQKHCL